MKTTKMLIAVALVGLASLTSCKKNYTCTCRTVIATGTVTETHDIDNAYLSDAKRACDNYEDQANASLPGGTTCGL